MQVNYGFLKAGDRFVYKNKEYIKTNKKEDKTACGHIYAVCISDGSMITFIGFDEVQKINPTPDDRPYLPPLPMW